ncbi:MAG: Methylmalonyl-CoA mutase [Candidatus Heimdallarchaeota archaeon LC_3]|nr:MAG: Methylmalonyl-CoA mutase [Candidatus Heimdallarchaeota archaeon LC_3]
MNFSELKKKWLEKYKDKLNLSNKSMKNNSGIDIDNLYGPDHSFSYEQQLNFPGEFPFTRGVYPSMYRGRMFTMRQYAGFATAKETNERYKFLLNQGQTGISVAFDLPTQIGYDSDDPLSRGEVGKTGVAICSLADMETLFEGIPLDKVSTSMTINAPASILICFYIAMAEKQGISIEKLRGTIQNDILKEYIARGTYIFPLKESMRLIVDTFEFCEKNLPKWNTISISGYHIREAGSTAVQEVAFTLANGIAYVEAAITAGLDPNKFGERLSFFFGSHNDFFEEIAKFRSARRLWAKIMKDRFGVTNPKAQMLRFHTQTAGVTLTAQQPENNAVRVAYQALSAILGGTQSLHTNSMDEALALPTPQAAQLALRTQQIAAFESGVTNIADPLAGSYYIEYLTNQIELKAMEYITKIDNMGGMITAIETGFVQKEIHNSAYKFQKEVENKSQTIVGVNEFISSENTEIPTLVIDKEKEDEQKERVKKVRASRDNKMVDKRLFELKNALGTNQNLIPLILDAVKSYATIGEIANTLRSVWGEYKSGDFL